jgi:hypothetical protein
VAKPYLAIGKYGSVGIELVLTILILAGIGHWLDVRYWHDSGYGVGVGFVLGCAIGFRNLIRTANSMQRDIERDEAKDPEANKWKVDEAWMHGDPPASGGDHDRDGSNGDGTPKDRDGGHHD